LEKLSFCAGEAGAALKNFPIDGVPAPAHPHAPIPFYPESEPGGKMSRFAIRDDDTSFFTQPEELEDVYGPVWGRCPISLAVIPFSVPVHRWNRFPDPEGTGGPKALGENRALVEYLRERVSAGMVEIMLHGYNHEYREYNGNWVAEYRWKPESRLRQETMEGKRYLEELLGCRIKVFVPPSNSISKGGILAVEAAGLHLSGIMGKGGDRPFSFSYLESYVKRWAYRATTGRPFPRSLRLGNHKELVAYALTPRASRTGLLSAIERCDRIEAPFVLATHYWEVRADARLRELLLELLDESENREMKSSTLSVCLEE
jgi:hypothetical protein